MGRSFIREHPSHICDTLCEIYQISVPEAWYRIDFLGSNEDLMYCGENVDYRRFYDAYVLKLYPLKMIPKMTQISASLCGAWASDIVPTIMHRINDQLRKDSRQEVQVEEDGEPFDIYRWAETHNEDVVDPETGYRYAVNDYNWYQKYGTLAKKRVDIYRIEIYDENNKFVGYAEKKK